jgi:hypothetical protein
VSRVKRQNALPAQRKAGRMSFEPENPIVMKMRAVGRSNAEGAEVYCFLRPKPVLERAG